MLRTCVLAFSTFSVLTLKGRVPGSSWLTSDTRGLAPNMARARDGWEVAVCCTMTIDLAPKTVSAQAK